LDECRFPSHDSVHPAAYQRERQVAPGASVVFWVRVPWASRREQGHCGREHGQIPIYAEATQQGRKDQSLLRLTWIIGGRTSELDFVSRAPIQW